MSSKLLQYIQYLFPIIGNKFLNKNQKYYHATHLKFNLAF